MKVSVLEMTAHRGKRFVFNCPACKTEHCVDDTWGFNGNVDAPTFTPSVLYREFEGDKVSRICHFYVKHGKIEYLSDCTHALAGKTVDMVDRPTPIAQIPVPPEA